MENIAELLATIQERQELIRMKEEIEAALETAQDKIKAAMGDTEVATVGPYKITYKEVSTTRLDTTAVKNAFPKDALAPYMKTTVSRPLRIT